MITIDIPIYFIPVIIALLAIWTMVWEHYGWQRGFKRCAKIHFDAWNKKL